MSRCARAGHRQTAVVLVVWRWGNGDGRHVGAWDREKDGAADDAEEEPRDVEVVPLKHPEYDVSRHLDALVALAWVAKAASGCATVCVLAEQARARARAEYGMKLALLRQIGALHADCAGLAALSHDAPHHVKIQ